MRLVTHKFGATTYSIAQGRIPAEAELPWRDEPCDVFVAIFEPNLLTDVFAASLALDVVRLNNDWVETMGPRAESMHDLIDEASVHVGRQESVGDGRPMTAWHNELVNAQAMAKWVAIGHGASENKLVVVIGSDSSAAGLSNLLVRVLQEREREQGS